MGFTKIFKYILNILLKFGNSYFQGMPLSGCLRKMKVCDNRDQLSVAKYCRKRFDLRCDRTPRLASDYVLCLGLALLVLSIKIHQFWLKIPQFPSPSSLYRRNH